MEIYKEKCREVLEQGEHGGYSYRIKTFGSHPCCYITIPKGHKYYDVDYYGLDLGVHGGLTYGKFNKDNIYEIGWDYAHAGDYSHYPELIKKHDTLFRDGKKWTLPELKQDVFDAIDEMNKNG